MEIEDASLKKAYEKFKKKQMPKFFKKFGLSSSKLRENEFREIKKALEAIWKDEIDLQIKYYESYSSIPIRKMNRSEIKYSTRKIDPYIIKVDNYEWINDLGYAYALNTSATKLHPILFSERKYALGTTLVHELGHLKHGRAGLISMEDRTEGECYGLEYYYAKKNPSLSHRRRIGEIMYARKILFRESRTFTKAFWRSYYVLKILDGIANDRWRTEEAKDEFQRDHKFNLDDISLTKEEARIERINYITNHEWVNFVTEWMRGEKLEPSSNLETLIQILDEKWSSDWEVKEIEENGIEWRHLG